MTSIETTEKVIKLTNYISKKRMYDLMEINQRTFEKKLYSNLWSWGERKMIEVWYRGVMSILEEFNGNAGKFKIHRKDLSDDTISAMVEVSTKKIPALIE